MRYRVIGISATDGAGLGEIGPLVARRLGFRLVDEGIVARAAREAGVRPHVLADVERRKSFVARLLAEIGPAGAASMSAIGGVVPLIGEGDAPDRDALQDLIRTAVEETAAQGDVVIVAHAASVALADRRDVLRVLVTASLDVRTQRLAEARGITGREARRLLEQADAARADYFRRFYGLGSEPPTLYDLVVSTDRLAVVEAAELVLAAAALETASR